MEFNVLLNSDAWMRSFSEYYIWYTCFIIFSVFALFIVNDALDEIFDESGDEEEQDAIVNQVLDEIGIEISGKVSDITFKSIYSGYAQSPIGPEKVLEISSKSHGKSGKSPMKILYASCIFKVVIPHIIYKVGKKKQLLNEIVIVSLVIYENVR